MPLTPLIAPLLTPVLALLVASAAGGSGPPTPIHAAYASAIASTLTEPDPKRAALADAVTHALTSPGYIRINAWITHEGKEIAVRSDMTAEKLRAEVFYDDALIAAFAVVGSRIQEFCPHHVPEVDDFEYINLMTEYDKLEVVNGEVSVGSAMILDPVIDALITPLTESWVDPRTERATWWHDRVINGTQLEDQTLRGIRCAVFQESITVAINDGADKLTVTNTIYIDPATALPLRWDTTQATSETINTRERQYEYTVAPAAPDDFVWTLVTEQLQNAVPPTRTESAATDR